MGETLGARDVSVLRRRRVGIQFHCPSLSSWVGHPKRAPSSAAPAAVGPLNMDPEQAWSSALTLGSNMLLICKEEADMKLAILFSSSVHFLGMNQWNF
jgi:hypothetical protein